MYEWMDYNAVSEGHLHTMIQDCEDTSGEQINSRLSPLTDLWSVTMTLLTQSFANMQLP